MKKVLLWALALLFVPVALPGQQEIGPVNIILSDNSADDPEAARPYALLRSEMIRQLSNMSNLYTIVEREHYDALAKERAGASSVKDDTYASSILNGATLLVELKITDYVENWDSIKILVGGSDVKPYNYKLSLNLKYELKVIDLSTTEVMGLVNLEARSYPRIAMGDQVETDKFDLRLLGYRQLRNAIWHLNQRHLLQIINPKIPIIDVAGDKRKAEEVLLLGGRWAQLPRGLRFKVIEEQSVTVAGKTVERPVTLGVISVSRNKLRNLTQCSIDSGAKEIFGAWKAGTAKYVQLGEDTDFSTAWPSPPKE